MAARPTFVLCAFARAGLEALVRAIRRNAYGCAATVLYTYDCERCTELIATARGLGVTVRLHSINRDVDVLRVEIDPATSVLCSVHYRDVISADVLALFRGRGVNMHPSLLPRYRGCFSSVWALINGERETGVTWHYMVPRLDSGNVLCQTKLLIRDTDTAFSLFHTLITLGLESMDDAVAMAQAGAPGQPQPLTDEPLYRRALPHGGAIDPRWSPSKQCRFVRAMHYPPYPSATDADGEPIATVEQLSVKRGWDVPGCSATAPSSRATVLFAVTHPGLLMGEATLLARAGHRVLIPDSSARQLVDLPELASLAARPVRWFFDVHDRWRDALRADDAWALAELARVGAGAVIASVDIVFPSLARLFERTAVRLLAYRAFGCDVTYDKLLAPGRRAFINASELRPFLVKRGRGARLLACYQSVVDCEPAGPLRENMTLVNLPLKLTLEPDTWVGGVQKLMFVYTVYNRAHLRIVQRHAKLFHDVPYEVFGRHAREFRGKIPHAVCDLPESAYYERMKTYAVMYYPSEWRAHLHFSAVEAILLGMPVLFSSGGMLELVLPDAPGLCRTDAEALTKVRRVLAGDAEFTERVVRTNKRALSLFARERCLQRYADVFATHGVIPFPAAPPGPTEG